jgi:hypothetical protein
MCRYNNLINDINFYFLVAQAAQIWGPYRNKKNRQFIIVKDNSGKKQTVSYPKYLLENHLKRKLDPNKETVHHKDGNHDNNDINNLEIIPRDIHSTNDTRRVKLIKLKCPMCKKFFERSPRLIRDKSSKGNTGPMCSRQCSGKYNRMVQLGLMDKLPVQPHVDSEYYKQREVEALADYFITKYAGYLG